jgi:hypothetical protein
MPKIIGSPLEYNQERVFENYEIERAHSISQDQLNDARLFQSRYEYAKTLNKNISYLEVGVGWGNSAEMFTATTNARSADLVDLYDNATGIMRLASEPEDISISHEEYIKNKFYHRQNVNTIKGDIREIFHKLNNQYDFMFFDMETERILIRNLLKHFSKLTKVGGIIGFTSYINYDVVNYDKHLGVFQSVNEFLKFNTNWFVDAIVLHDLGYHDIYIKRNS